MLRLRLNNKTKLKSSQGVSSSRTSSCPEVLSLSRLRKQRLVGLGAFYFIKGLDNA